jgi:anti-sigma regulatory factor (Ser/Thr protein kinase)
LPTFAADPASVGAARAYVTDALAGVGEDVRWAAVLLTSELVSNVIKHTDSEIRVTVEPPTRIIRVAVHDGVAATQAFRSVVAGPPPAIEATASGGRGMRMVHELAQRLGLDEDPGGGKVVWFELDARDPEEP